MLDIRDTDKILIVSPHPDDETIGCGGLLLKYGAQCSVLLLTDGSKGYNSKLDCVDEKQLADRRESEMLQALSYADLSQIDKLQIPDGEVAKNQEIIQKYDITSYTKIFVPNQLEFHKDHKPVFKIFQAMKKRQKSNALIYEYEVWSPLSNPNRWLDLSDIIDDKKKMIQSYSSQIKYKDYEKLVIGLAMYRGSFFQTDYAEAFQICEDSSFVKSIYRKIPFSVRRIIWQIKHRKGKV